MFAASRSASELKGRTPARAKIAASVAKARDWAEAELAKALADVLGGGDRAAARTALEKVSPAFAGEPEAKDADLGVKAIERLGVIDGVAAEKQPAVKEKAAKDFEGTRWAALFGAAPAQEPAQEPEEARWPGPAAASGARPEPIRGAAPRRPGPAT